MTPPTMPPLYLSLVHYPVLDRAGNDVVTSVTNLDIHDISRSCATFGVSQLAIITPILAQQELVESIIANWTQEGLGAKRIPERSQALSLVKTYHNLESLISSITSQHACAPHIIATSARNTNLVERSYSEERLRLIKEVKIPTLYLFGTGQGLSTKLDTFCQARLSPIRGPRSSYNHLSVRAACAITLSKLLSS